MNRNYTLHDDTAKRLYKAAFDTGDKDVEAAAGTLAAQNPELRGE